MAFIIFRKQARGYQQVLVPWKSKKTEINILGFIL